MIIEIKGVQFVNKGAELMLCAIIQKVKEFWPEAEIVLAPNENSPYLNRAKIGAWQKLSLRKYPFDLNGLTYYFPSFFKRYLRKWGIVTEADIDVILDASGFAYGDQWNTVLLQQALAEASRQNTHSKKYIFLPQAFGPFRLSKSQQLVKKFMSQASLVCAREDVSYQHLSALLPNTNNLALFPDFTNALEPNLSGLNPKYADRVCIIPNHNMVSNKNPNAGWHKSYIDFLVYCVERVRALGIEPFILNHEGQQDLVICNQINSKLSLPLDVITESDPTKVKGMIKQSKAVICSRFHGCVSALSQAVPCLATSWSHKYEQLFSEYGVREYLVEDNWQPELVDSLINNAVSNEENLNANLLANSKKYKEITELMWAKVVEAVHRTSSEK